MNALVRLGIGVSADREKGEVYVSGQGGGIDASGVDLFVGNAGTVARFLPPVLALGRGPYTVDGVPRMRERPVADLVDAMRQLGAAVDYAGEDGRFPLAIKGGGIRGGDGPRLGEQEQPVRKRAADGGSLRRGSRHALPRGQERMALRRYHRRP